MGSSYTPGAVPGLRHVVLAAVVTATAAASLACGGGKLPAAGSPAVSRTVYTGASVVSSTRPAGSVTVTAPKPGTTSSVAANATAKPASSTGASDFQTTRYTVVSGDNPGSIAEKLGVPLARRESWIAEMLALNGATATSLQIGQDLILPPFDAGAPLPTRSASPVSNPSTAGDAPTATDAPQPTDTPAATGTPAGTNTPAPTATQPASTPTPAPTADPNRLELVSVTSPIASGNDATLVVQVAPGKSCRLAYNNPNGSASPAAGLGTQTAGEDGKITWTWGISPNTSPGTGTAYVTCGTKEMSVSIPTTSS